MKDTTIREIIRKKVAEARKQAGITQAEVAELLDISGGGYAAKETGVSGISADELCALAAMFGVPVNSLCPNTKEMPRAYHLAFENKRNEKLKKQRDSLLAEVAKINRKLNRSEIDI